MTLFWGSFRQALQVLVRERILLVTLLVAVCAFVLCGLLADLSLEDAQKSLFDLGFLSFHFIGGLVAILLGARLFSDTHERGSLVSTQLPHVHTRFLWLLGRFAALGVCLLTLAFVLQLMWQALLVAWGYTVMKPAEWLVLNAHTLEWLVLGTLAATLGIVCRPLMALFVSICLWLAGLMSTASAQLMSEQSPDIAKFLLFTLARIWNLRRFNLADPYAANIAVSQETLMWLGIYGICWVAILITIAGLSFEKKDVL